MQDGEEVVEGVKRVERAEQNKHDNRKERPEWGGGGGVTGEDEEKKGADRREGGMGGDGEMSEIGLPESKGGGRVSSGLGRADELARAFGLDEGDPGMLRCGAVLEPELWFMEVTPDRKSREPAYVRTGAWK